MPEDEPEETGDELLCLIPLRFLSLSLYFFLSLSPTAISHDNRVLVQPEAHGHTDKTLARGDRESGAPSVIMMFFALST